MPSLELKAYAQGCHCLGLFAEDCTPSQNLAHETCLYPKSLRSDMPVKVMVD